jgi:AraC-like DNA-binding protein
MPLSKIAEQIGYSARHTARIIKETYGCSLLELRKKQLLPPKK